MNEPPNEIGYCGMVCSVCSHRTGTCAGCAAGGGDDHCVQRLCNRQRRLEGCWQCEEASSCEKGYFGDPAWRGLNVAFTRFACEHGPAALAAAARRGFGRNCDFGEYRHRTPEAILDILNGSAMRSDNAENA